MVFTKRAQLSIETMIIYGLVTLVALSVVGALLYFNILDVGNYLPDTCNIGGAGDLKCEEMKLVSGGNFELGIRNIGQKPIELLQVKATDEDGLHFSGSKIGSATDTSDVAIDTSNTLAPGEIGKVVVDVSSDNVQRGKIFRGTLNTQYRFNGGAITQEASGTIRLKAS